MELTSEEALKDLEKFSYMERSCRYKPPEDLGTEVVKIMEYVKKFEKAGLFRKTDTPIVFLEKMEEKYGGMNYDGIIWMNKDHLNSPIIYDNLVHEILDTHFQRFSDHPFLEHISEILAWEIDANLALDGDENYKSTLFHVLKMSAGCAYYMASQKENKLLDQIQETLGKFIEANKIERLKKLTDEEKEEYFIKPYTMVKKAIKENNGVVLTAAGKKIPIPCLTRFLKDLY